MKTFVIKISLLVLFNIFSISIVLSQSVYKTPSGKKYHLANCRMVENVSKKLLNPTKILKLHLTPCKICKPPAINNVHQGNSLMDKSVGKDIKSHQCKGFTKKGSRCKHQTKLANGYCYQHSAQNSKNSTKIKICGARTKSGSFCKR